IVQTTPPREPFMCRSRRFEIYVVDSRPGQLLAEVLCVGALDRPNPKEENLHLLVEGGGVGENAAVGGFWIESRATAARSAETAEIRELVEIRQYGQERLHTAHRETSHRAVLAARRDPVGVLHHRDEIVQHHIGEGLVPIRGESTAPGSSTAAPARGWR